MSAQQTTNTAAKQKKKTIILVLVILVLLGIILYLLFGKSEPKRNVVVTEGNAQEIMLELSEMDVVPPGQFEANMNSNWHFKDGSSPSRDAYVGNVPGNTHDIYFDVELADSGEVILESPVIPRGSHMENITLDKDLDAGTYDCVLIYHLIDENQDTVGTLRMTLTIIVEG